MKALYFWNLYDSIIYFLESTQNLLMVKVIACLIEDQNNCAVSNIVFLRSWLLEWLSDLLSDDNVCTT